MTDAAVLTVDDALAQVASMRNEIERLHARVYTLEGELGQANVDRLNAAIDTAAVRQARGWLDLSVQQAGEIEDLRAAIADAVSDLREHYEDGCTGPDGDPPTRRGACAECRIARDLERAARAEVKP